MVDATTSSYPSTKDVKMTVQFANGSNVVITGDYLHVIDTYKQCFMKFFTCNFKIRGRKNKSSLFDTVGCKRFKSIVYNDDNDNNNITHDINNSAINDNDVLPDDPQSDGNINISQNVTSDDLQSTDVFFDTSKNTSEDLQSIDVSIDTTGDLQSTVVNEINCDSKVASVDGSDAAIGDTVTAVISDIEKGKDLFDDSSFDLLKYIEDYDVTVNDNASVNKYVNRWQQKELALRTILDTAVSTTGTTSTTYVDSFVNIASRLQKRRETAPVKGSTFIPGVVVSSPLELKIAKFVLWNDIVNSCRDVAKHFGDINHDVVQSIIVLLKSKKNQFFNKAFVNNISAVKDIYSDIWQAVLRMILTDPNNLAQFLASGGGKYFNH